MEEIWNLRNAHLFRGLTPAQMDEVLKTMPVRSYRRHEYIFMAGDEADALYIVQLGTVKVGYVDLNGEEKILDIFQAGDIFGYLFLGKYRQRIGNAQAMADVVLCRLTEVDFIQLIQKFPLIALNFIRQQADEYRETVARMHALMSMDARHRLLGTLLTLARRYCCDEGAWFALPESLTQEDIAKMTGLNRSTVSLLINELRRESVLGGVGRQVLVNKTAVEAIMKAKGSEILE
ncbi:MAG: Crp/Fnr family transcriptional regulator [Chloroflexi bacterium]|nr:Crp/Fnr family transcriptional regulator [Chloroflexota bacterium]